MHPTNYRTTPPRVNENSLAALTGARVSELLALTWAEVRLEDLDDAEIEFAWQVDRRGERGPTNTDGSARTVPIPRELAVVLSRHKLASPLKDPDDFVFATCTGGPLRQRNVGRALRVAQRNAMKDDGGPTFPISPQTDEHGESLRVPPASCRRCTASGIPSPVVRSWPARACDEIAFLLGHRDANVTRGVYVRELADTRRRSMRRSRMIAEFGQLLEQ